MANEVRIVTHILEYGNSSGMDAMDPSAEYRFYIGNPGGSTVGHWAYATVAEVLPLIQVLKLNTVYDLVGFKFGCPENDSSNSAFKSYLEGLHIGDAHKKRSHELILERAAQALANVTIPNFALEPADVVRDTFQDLFDNADQWEAFCKKVTLLSSGHTQIHERHPSQFHLRLEGVRYYELVSRSGCALFVFGPYHPMPFQYSMRVTEAPHRANATMP